MFERNVTLVICRCVTYFFLCRLGLNTPVYIVHVLTWLIPEEYIELRRSIHTLLKTGSHRHSSNFNTNTTVSPQNWKPLRNVWSFSIEDVRHFWNCTNVQYFATFMHAHVPPGANVGFEIHPRHLQKPILSDTSPFLRPLTPLLRTSYDISSRFQSQRGQNYSYWEMCV